MSDPSIGDAPAPPEALTVDAPEPASSPTAMKLAVATAVLGLLHRLTLARRYYGQEEEDWGTVGLIFGAYQSGLRYIETEHMPLYVDLAAVATFFFGGDAEAGGQAVAILAGTFVVGLTTWLGARWFSPLAGLVAGLLVAVQPESALYSATTLRVSTYTALMLSGVALVGLRRFPAAGLCLAAAFLTRFDAAFVFLPALALTVQWLRQRPPEGEERWTRRWEGAALAFGILLLAVLLWAAYYQSQEGTFAFWGGVGERNANWNVGAGFGTLYGVVSKLLPGHIGWPILLTAPVGAFLVLGRLTAAVGPARWLLFAAIAGWGFFFTIVVVSAYHWDHNLYWKWFSPNVPALCLLSVHGVVEVLRRLSRRGAAMKGAAVGIAAIGLLGTGAVFSAQTTTQLARSDAWNGTQIRLMQWFEEHYPEDAGVLGALVPNTYLLRRPTERRVNYWHDEGIPDEDPEAFGRYLVDQNISVVVWFREEWVQAISAAPFLALGEPVDAGPVTLVPIAREDGYGFIAYQVHGAGFTHPTEAPPGHAGGLPAVFPPAGSAPAATSPSDG